MRDIPASCAEFPMHGFLPHGVRVCAVLGGRLGYSGAMAGREPVESELPVHAAAASAVAVIPLPLLGGMLTGVARGSALRRVLRRRGVRFGPGARAELASFRVGNAGAGVRLVLRKIPGLGLGNRLEAGIATWLSARLIDRYLSENDVGPSLHIDEARLLRLALDACFAEGLGRDALRLIPELVRLSGRTVSAPFRDDLEGRAPHLRAVDTLLDGLSDLPADFFVDFDRRFDAALADLQAREGRS